MVAAVVRGRGGEEFEEDVGGVGVGVEDGVVGRDGGGSEQWRQTPCT